ncbi:MAG: M23 family metallopeptidase [Oscillospiraceae bacterium]|nr:M23 family metallopeptidase [Oscillospiraceae bacterium]
MDNRGKRQAASIFGGMGFYIALLVCVVAAGVVGYFALLSSEEDPAINYGNSVEPVTGDDVGTAVMQPENTDTEMVLSDEPLPVTTPMLPEVQEDTTETIGENLGDGEIVELPVSGEVTVVETTEPASVSQRIVAPLLGDTVAVFSVDQLMYDATLGDWRTHDGVDICAETGTPVVATAAGTVRSVNEDGRLGVCVTIEHANGYVTTYASLHPEVTVMAGDSVDAGSVIGSVGNTSLSEAGLGAHLHFSVSKNGVAMDPISYLPQQS